MDSPELAVMVDLEVLSCCGATILVCTGETVDCRGGELLRFAGNFGSFLVGGGLGGLGAVIGVVALTFCKVGSLVAPALYL
jgi:hypothetical protein